MERRTHLYVAPGHLCLWLTGLCMAASALVRPAYFGAGVFSALVLPWAAAGMYVLIAAMSGAEQFHRSAVPVWLLGLSCALRGIDLLGRAPWMYAGLALCLAALCAGYTAVVSGRIGRGWLPVLALAAMALALWAQALPDALMVLGVLALIPCVKVHTDGAWHPTWGDRVEGRRVRTAPAMEQITAYFMPNRTGANNLFAESVEITALERYVRRKRREGLTNFGPGHVLMAAYVRTVARYPALNRFVAGQKIYSRGEDVALCMTVKKELTAAAPDSVVKVHLHPGDTAEEVYRKFQAQSQAAKDEMEDTTADATAAAFVRIPGLLLKFVVWLLKTLDYFGLIPRFLLEVSPFHGSVYFTSMGSLGIRPVYHHLYDFGTVPVFCAFGRKRRAEELENGEPVVRKYMDLRFNLDERICDGFYYAGALKYFLRLLSRPEQLDQPPEAVIQDIP